MGYHTTFGLRVQEKESRKEIRDIYEYEEEINKNGGGINDNTKWYEYEDDMLEYSKKYPNLIFILDGRGDDGDEWRIFFVNGKQQVSSEVNTTYSEFDEELLK